MTSEEKRLRKNEINKAYYHRNKIRLKEKQRIRSHIDYHGNTVFRDTKLERQAKKRKKNPERTTWYAAKHRAKKRGLAFNIEISDINIPKICPILKIPIIIGGGRGDTSPSLDRIDNTKGYIKGNIHIISDRANRLKSDASLVELEQITKYLKELKEIFNNGA